MTRIDFHLNVSNHLHYVCRLVRKAHSTGLKVVCYSTNTALLAELDDLLWTFSEEDFLPHAMTGQAEVAHSPIVLTHQADDITHHDLLINLDERWPPFFARFERLVEIVGTDEQHKQMARQRYKFYKDRGYPLQTHDRAG